MQSVNLTNISNEEQAQSLAPFARVSAEEAGSEEEISQPSAC